MLLRAGDGIARRSSVHAPSSNCSAPRILVGYFERAVAVAEDAPTAPSKQ
jgi:hypothetical protein